MRCIIIADDVPFQLESTREVRSHPLGIPVHTKVGGPGLMATSTLCRILPKSLSLSHIILHVNSHFESSMSF